MIAIIQGRQPFPLCRLFANFILPRNSFRIEGPYFRTDRIRVLLQRVRTHFRFHDLSRSFLRNASGRLTTQKGLKVIHCAIRIITG